MAHKLIVFALAVFSFSFCYKEAPMEIDGVWRGEQPPYWILAISDGHYVQKLPADGYILEYAYRVNGNTVTLESLSGGMSRNQIWDISGNSCTVFEVGNDVPEAKYVKIGE